MSTPRRASSTSIGDLPRDWCGALREASTQDVLARIDDFVAHEREAHEVFPRATDVFAALRLAPCASVRAVILGQDPTFDTVRLTGMHSRFQMGSDSGRPVENLH